MLTLDVSHWGVVCERMLAGHPSIDAVMQFCAGRTRHVHARVGSDQA